MLCVTLCAGVHVVGVVCRVVVVAVVVLVVCVRCGGHAERPRVLIQNGPVCTFKTPPCVPATCGIVAGTHGDVLNVHMGAF